MKIWIALIILALVLGAGTASAHRMFVGQRITVEACAVFDDGSPANDAPIKVYRENATSGLYELYHENVTDSSGRYELCLPGKGTGNWLFQISSGGHKEEFSLSISDGRSDLLKAGIPALAVLPVALFAWKRRGKR